MSLGLLLLSGQQAKRLETPKEAGGTIVTSYSIWTPPEPEATLDDPVRKDGRIIYTLSLKDDWSCAPMSNWTSSGYTDGKVTAIQLVCVKTAAVPASPKPAERSR
jgi:hypothetical protein